ncbi:putative ankyrin repeat protein RF_0381 [Saccostrea cucullata]|uniref:putative ankyrin repeat protein RF_0381 n=1 Tax=Saccostrea cuccullata TaxID=36930 RepID=UPI002ECFD721
METVLTCAVKHGKLSMLLSEKDNYGEDVLYKAAAGDKEDVCRFLVNNFPDFINKRNNAGWTALHCAYEGGNVGHLTFLSDKGLDIDALTNCGKCSLHIACYSANYDVSRYLAENYTKFLHIIDKRGHTVLNDASFGGSVDIFKLLITKGLDINCVDHDGKTVLHICCSKGRKEMCEYLVENFPTLLDIKDINGYTVLHDACIGGRVDVVDFLVTKGIDIKAVTNIKTLNEHTYPKNREMSQSLKKFKNINVLGGKTVLHISCLYCRGQICEYLVQRYPQLMEVKDNAGNTALHDACLGGNVGILSFLLRKGMDINALTTIGNSVLHASCIGAKYHVCEYLVNNFPHLLNIINKDGYKCLHSSAAGALHLAASSGNINVVKLLKEKGVDIMSTGLNGKTVLHLSSMNSRKEMCKYILEHYPELKDTRDEDGHTALHDACEGGDVDTVSFLLDRGFDINALTNTGKERDYGQILEDHFRGQDSHVLVYNIVEIPKVKNARTV